MLALATLTTLVALLHTARGGIQHFAGVRLPAESHHNTRIGMFALGDAPFRAANESRISLALKFALDPPNAEDASHSLTLAVFHSSYGFRVGYYDHDTQTTEYCCTPELLHRGKCSQPYTAIVNRTSLAGGALARADLPFTGNTDAYDMQFDVAVSGIYYVYIFNCNKFDTPNTAVVVSGTIKWQNPTGQLSAEVYPFLPFYGVLALLYLVIGIVWFGLSMLHWRKLLTIQNWIAGVIFLGMAESATLYFDNLQYNEVGEESPGAAVFAILMSTLKRTVSRVLVLVVSMGYGVVKPTLGTTRYKVSLLGMLYFIFSAGLMLVQAGDKSTADVSWATALFLVVPVALLDTGFYWWIFLSLLRTIAQLTARRQVVKLSMYKWLFNTLAASAILSAIVVLYQVFSFAVTETDDNWRTAWMWPAFWQLLYLFVLLAIVALWRPTYNNTRYAYADVRGDEKALDDITLEQGTPKVVLRHQNDDINIGTEDVAAVAVALDAGTQRVAKRD